jgi:hypothetical protein
MEHGQAHSVAGQLLHEAVCGGAGSYGIGRKVPTKTLQSHKCQEPDAVNATSGVSCSLKHQKVRLWHYSRERALMAA